MRGKMEAALFTGDQMADLLGRVAQNIMERHSAMSMIGLVGIRTGGAFLARRLQKMLAQKAGAGPELGVMDITLYRDDWTRLHNRPKLGPTEINFPVEGLNVILVDDVLYTGRTARAALDALIDFGRPNRIELAVLIDRGGRELPIQPDYVGATLRTGEDEIIDVMLTEGGSPDDVVLKRLV